ncbi:Fc receptor-like protein 5 isoform X2 [Nothobranchius furzeri]|uniref:Fc receptor-like protein 5 isoform X2 n=1 Tax=Nothobranchius furzeri TaxID=105023 RepID=UPI00077D249B
MHPKPCDEDLAHFNLVMILALACLLSEISASAPLHLQLTGPNMAYLNTRAVFRCFAPDSAPTVTYKLIKDKRFPIAMHIGHKWNWNATFSLKVKASSDGSYRCEATAGGTSGVSNSIRLAVVTPASNTRVTSDPSPPVAYEGSRVLLSCEVDRGSHLYFTWYFNRKEIISGFNLSGNKLVMERVTLGNAGNYYCIAWSAVQDIRRFSTSTEVTVSVKVYVSKPKISFSLFKVGDGYRGNITCWALRGSLPVNFSLLLDDKELGSITATESLAACFDVAMVIGLDMGDARCRVKTEVQDLKSEPVTLEVVPVGGDVNLQVDYLYTAGAELAAARMNCHISRGTFPLFSWLFNNSVLPSEDRHVEFVLSQPGPGDPSQTLILTELSPKHSGYYQCSARDSYDPSGSWVQSAAVLVHITDQIRYLKPQGASPTETPQQVLLSPFESISLLFCCFFLLMLGVAVLCVCKMFHQDSTNISSLNPPSLHLSEPESHAGALQAPVLSAVQNQAPEMTPEE